MNQMSVKAEEAEKRADAAEETVKTVRNIALLPHDLAHCIPPCHQLKQDLLQKEQQISSLEHRLKIAEDENERHETSLKDLKTRAEESDTHKTTGDNLSRKVQMLEEELERSEKELKDVTEKYVAHLGSQKARVPDRRISPNQIATGRRQGGTL